MSKLLETRFAPFPPHCLRFRRGCQNQHIFLVAAILQRPLKTSLSDLPLCTGRDLKLRHLPQTRPYSPGDALDPKLHYRQVLETNSQIIVLLRMQKGILEMSPQRSHVNLPTEAARTLLLVQQTGSLTKAAQMLGLTQPAVSSQLKRVEQIVGGPVFEREGNGSQVTELGRSVLQHCRRMIDANDDIVAIGGFIGDARLLRVGVSAILMRSLLTGPDLSFLSNVSVCSERSATLARRLFDRQLDVALLLDGNEQLPTELQTLVRREFTDDLIWVCSPNLFLSPAAPIPIIPWADDNDPMRRVLTANGIAFRIAFSGGDFDSKKLAVEAGMGLTCLPRRQVPPGFISAEGYKLPSLPRVKGLLCVCQNVDESKVACFVDRLSKMFFD